MRLLNSATPFLAISRVILKILCYNSHIFDRPTMATRVGLLTIPMRMLNSATLKTPCLVKIFDHVCYISGVIANFVLEFPHSRYHGNKGRFFKNSNEAKIARP